MVVEEGGEARTVNLCQQCHDERRVQQGEPGLKLVAMEGSRGEEGTSWKNLENHGKRAFTRGRVLFSEEAEAKRIRDDAAREKQEGIQGQWQ